MQVGVPFHKGAMGVILEWAGLQLFAKVLFTVSLGCIDLCGGSVVAEPLRWNAEGLSNLASLHCHVFLEFKGLLWVIGGKVRGIRII